MNTVGIRKVLAEKREVLGVYKKNIASGFWKLESVRPLMARLRFQIEFFEHKLKKAEQ
jgi:hypothetical protein